MKKKCPFCEKEIANFLEHVSIRHGVSTPEEYELKVEELEKKKLKIQEFGKYTEELMVKFRKGEISPEQLRDLRAKWERDNNLIW